MARFYFHLWRGGQLTPDEAGAVLSTREAAERRAQCMAGSIRDQGEDAPPDMAGWDIEVTDAAGRTVLVVPVELRDLDSELSRAA